MQETKRYTVTAALPYANGPLHIGHLAGAYLPADIYVRYLRASGRDVLFVCGSDEHGVAITIKARSLGITPRELIDRNHELLRDGFQQFNIAFDVYSRTSLPLHHETAQEFFRMWQEKGLFVEKTTEQFYDPEAGMFLADRYIVGTCPKCGNENAYGDQCERCGTSLSPADLINPRSALTNTAPELRPTRHWYLPLDRYQPEIEDYILRRHADWKHNVLGQCRSWLNDGLQPRAITRDMDWGVPVPGAEGKVLYVWFDAPIGYISASKDWALQRGAPDAWKPYWQEDDTRLIHFIGKDNIVFHCIIFPVILMGRGEYILADNVPANEFLNLEGDKISTSRNWAVWAHEFAADHPDKIDVMRYVLIATAPETKDSEFTWKDFQTRNNSELVAILGNFVNRIITLCHKYTEGQAPTPNNFDAFDLATLDTIPLLADKIAGHIETFSFREALAEAMNLARAGNKYLADTEPWHLIKNNPERVPTVLYVALQIAAALGVAFEPFLPETAGKIRNMLGMTDLTWTRLKAKELISPGTSVAQGALLFQKIEDTFVEEQVAKLQGEKPDTSVAPAKEEITIDQFDAMDIRVGTVLTAERIPKADKLLKLEIDTGLDKRTVLSGIAEHFSPEEVVGRQVMILVNLKPRKMRGFESQGMILMSEDADGKLVFARPDRDVPNGATVR